MSDLIFWDADIITMDDANPSAQAIRIQGNRIKEIGSAELVGDFLEIDDLNYMIRFYKNERCFVY